MEHFITGPSCADLWSRCKGYLQTIINCPPEEDIEAAQEGTAAHYFSEEAIKDGTFDVTGYVGVIHEKTGVMCTDEMAEFCNVYTSRVKELYDMCKAIDVVVDIRTEYRVDLSHIYPGFFGTRDAHVIAIFNDWAIVIDLKYGRVLVPAYDNRQLMCYALDIINKYPGVKYVRFEIVQPRGFASWGNIDVADYTREMLEAFAPVAAEYQAANHSKEYQECTPGPHCTYCKGMGRCRANMLYVMNMAEPVNFNPNLLSAEEVEKVIRQSKLLDRFIKGAYAYGRQLAIQGAAFKELKMVESLSKSQPVKDPVKDIADIIRLATGKAPDMDKLAPRKLAALSEIRKIYGDKVADLLTQDKKTVIELRGIEEGGTAVQSKMMQMMAEPVKTLESK